jgi:hypothetical protein
MEQLEEGERPERAPAGEERVPAERAGKVTRQERPDRAGGPAHRAEHPQERGERARGSVDQAEGHRTCEPRHRDREEPVRQAIDAGPPQRDGKNSHSFRGRCCWAPKHIQ